ncbi:hypothetical protein CDAR_256491 [Caerostris darwini]|uniref:Uncharacterized protein n=1 Tax=Caerostris darwini TaxID=1538125 RepID=A0AAV4PGY0_9ARAC|nr:hypothetical protein CDAR_256491 [Caerostris darwini]
MSYVSAISNSNIEVVGKDKKTKGEHVGDLPKHIGERVAPVPTRGLRRRLERPRVRKLRRHLGSCSLDGENRDQWSADRTPLGGASQAPPKKFQSRPKNRCGPIDAPKSPKRKGPQPRGKKSLTSRPWRRQKKSRWRACSEDHALAVRCFAQIEARPLFFRPAAYFYAVVNHASLPSNPLFQYLKYSLLISFQRNSLRI